MSAVPDKIYLNVPFPEKDRAIAGHMMPLAEAIFEVRVATIAKRFMANAKRDSQRLSSQSQEAAFSIQVIRAALQAGAMDRIAYTDMEN